MRNHDHVLRRVEIDHTNLDIQLDTKGDEPPVTPTLVMEIDNLSGRAINWRLEWLEHLVVTANSFQGRVYTELIRAIVNEAYHLPHPCCVSRHVLH